MRLISRIVLNAQLYDPVPPWPASTPGVKPSKGPRQPKLSARLTDAVTEWQTCAVTWYGQRAATVEVATGTALRHTGHFRADVASTGTDALLWQAAQ